MNFEIWDSTKDLQKNVDASEWIKTFTSTSFSLRVAWFISYNKLIVFNWYSESVVCLRCILLHTSQHELPCWTSDISGKALDITSAVRVCLHFSRTNSFLLWPFPQGAFLDSTNIPISANLEFPSYTPSKKRTNISPCGCMQITSNRVCFISCWYYIFQGLISNNFLSLWLKRYNNIC